MSKAGEKGKDGGEELSLALGEIVDLYEIGLGDMKKGFPGLNGFHKAVGETTILNPYSLTDEVRQKITRNKFRLRPFIEELYTEARATLIREIMDDSLAVFIPPQDRERNARFAVRDREILRLPHTVTIFVFQRSDLFRDNKNPIPGDVELALGPIIEGSDWRFANITKKEEPPGGET